MNRPPANLNENKRQREALLPGLEPASTNRKLHTSYCISLGQAYCAFIHFKRTKKSRITHGTLPQTWTIVYLKPVPAQGKRKSCGEPCSSKGMHARTRYNIWANNINVLKTNRKKETKNGKRWKRKKERLPGLELASLIPKLYPSYIPTAGVFFCIYTRTRYTKNTNN